MFVYQYMITLTTWYIKCNTILKLIRPFSVPVQMMTYYIHVYRVRPIRSDGSPSLSTRRRGFLDASQWSTYTHTGYLICQIWYIWTNMNVLELSSCETELFRIIIMFLFCFFGDESLLQTPVPKSSVSIQCSVWLKTNSIVGESYSMIRDSRPRGMHPCDICNVQQLWGNGELRM